MGLIRAVKVAESKSISQYISFRWEIGDRE